MKLKLVDKEIQTGDVKSFVFEPDIPVEWAAGQFMVYRLDHENPDIRGKQRFFTISSAPFEKHIVITTHIQKDKSSTFKKSLDSLKIGDFIEAKGPDGDFILEDPNKNYVFIAGGIGITPFHSIIADLAHKSLPINITLFYANKTEEFPFKEEFEKIREQNTSFKVHYVVSPKHIDENLIKENVADLQKKIFYVSGPEKMVEDLTEMIKGIGIKEENIKQDFFPGYDPI
ncbi:MAG TPA: FAD-dependent oxidoreductase [Patescibacteria group bacterium]|nr:FAD-dependent oxidoreductase [Patescibacteria group bacterium]